MNAGRWYKRSIDFERPDDKWTYIFHINTHITPDPAIEVIAQMTIWAAKEVKRFRPQPRAALLSLANSAVSPCIRHELFPKSNLEGVASLHVMPNLDAVSFSNNMVKVVDRSVSLGPMTFICHVPAHIVTSSTRVGGPVSMAAIAAARREEVSARAS